MFTAVLLALLALTVSADRAPRRTFGVGLSQASIYSTETTFYEYNVSSASSRGVITHFWVTGGDEEDVDNYIFRYYLDGETTASIQFTPAMMCGVGTFNNTAKYTDPPWSARRFGKGSTNGGWFWDWPIPFSSSLRVTSQLPAYHKCDGEEEGVGCTRQRYFVQVRGVENAPIVVGGVTLPDKARMVQQRIGNVDTTLGEGVVLSVLEYVDLYTAPPGTDGCFLMSTLAVATNSDNFMEGCFHAYNPMNASFPGEIIGTGTEDWYNSAYYFAAGPFTFPETGLTVHQHQLPGPYSIIWSAYRIQDNDPQFFSGGYRLQWRNGDSSGPSGLKCVCANTTCGEVVGAPTPSMIWHYGWGYVW